MSKLFNHHHLRFNFNINDLCQEVLEDEEIDMDIDNETVNVIQHVKGNNVYQCASP